MAENETSEDENSDPVSHSEMKDLFRSTLKTLFESDPTLNDLHGNVTHQEIQGLIEVEKGRSILVTVMKENGEEFALRVPRDSKVHHLKSALRTAVTVDMGRKGIQRGINWRSVWRRFSLHNTENDVPLTDGNALLEQVAVTHKSLLVFKPIKRRRK